MIPLRKFQFKKHNHFCDWDNCSGYHLEIILPNGTAWDVDSRAVNCSAKWDKNHRCWVRFGEAPFWTIKKEGYTCDAGGGSVLVRHPTLWHGFLRNGNFYEEGIPPEAL
jgi:hypothetical protein